MCNRPTEKQHSFNHPAQLQQLAAAARRPEKRDLGNKVTKKGQKCSRQRRRTSQVHEGMAVLVPCPADGSDGGLRGAQMPCEEEQSCFCPPSLTAQHQSRPAVQGSPLQRCTLLTGGGSYCKYSSWPSWAGRQAGRQRPQPSPPVAGPRHRPPARCRSRGSPLVNSPAWCGGKAAMRRGYSPKVVLF